MAYCCLYISNHHRVICYLLLLMLYQVADMRTGCTVLYRLRFVRDIMLHPKIDDPGITAIGSMISFSSSEICTMVRTSDAYFDE